MFIRQVRITRKISLQTSCLNTKVTKPNQNKIYKEKPSNIKVIKKSFCSSSLWLLVTFPSTSDNLNNLYWNVSNHFSGKGSLLSCDHSAFGGHQYYTCKILHLQVPCHLNCSLHFNVLDICCIGDTSESVCVIYEDG